MKFTGKIIGTCMKAYRKLMSQHHPDKLIARGLSADMIKQAGGF